ncbi:MAG: BON domain-containing protein, partial [Phycisphaeraceae bacterium]|nr:BON domain-containing protein [Phycisphaeraceae bacterium]
KNHIKVRPVQVTDSQIKQSIENALLRDPDVDRFEITVNVISGEAYLNGTVDTYFEKIVAEDVASTAKGVMEVHNNLRVEDKTVTPKTYDPYVDGRYFYDYDWLEGEYEVTFKTDWEIHNDIRDELYWSPFVDSDEVAVTVEEGVATLTGQVDTWSERNAAEENAREGGAIAVINNLTVDYGPDYYQSNGKSE